MTSIICKTSIYQDLPAKAIVVSRPLMDKWGCSNGQSITIEIGNKAIITRIVRARSQDHQIFVSPTMAKQLCLPYPGFIRATFNHKSIRLGPVIGILTTGYTGNNATPFGARSALFRSFINASKDERPYIYVFTPEMVDWNNKSIHGWYYLPDKNQQMRWIRFTSPLPDVVYERVPNRKAESLNHVQNCLQKLRNYTHCKVFNQGFFNKWSIHEWLNDHEVVGDYMPETHISPDVDTLQRMLEDYRMVYLKPSGGSLGLGIFRITKHPKGGYYCRFHQDNQNVLHRFHSLKNLVNYYFGKEKSTRLQRYLVQQGIRLIKHENRPVDFRVHMHKNKLGSWQVIAIGSKAAGIGSVTTHVRTGGSIIPTDQLLDEVFKHNAETIKKSITETAIHIAEALEERVEGPLGELGMDIGVDQLGYVWLFEINSKPGRHIFLHPSLRDAGRQSAKCITDYSLKLSNFI
ncbi:YheC/YheD family protein [Hazenella sp. IB182357]|uniref:YheC/YheD family protein n=1 Tax=Polycladospora coralii TaxID=2771432 RepID=A0A926RUW5_9BACL|nr:YheC/YheD family protein [Polycladospora coralii]MBD1373097.1 YheC/YheD family protein [Polycladospora coralii]MBS7529558.1 YheC/YheD family protein [Polycladospora coralii]